MFSFLVSIGSNVGLLIEFVNVSLDFRDLNFEKNFMYIFYM